jgi:hypothetical protein
MSEGLVLPLTSVGLAFVALCASPAIIAILTQLRDRTPKDNFYEDRDGKATPESIAAFSNRRPKTVILLLSSVGAGTSIAIAILSTIDRVKYGSFLENWLIAAAWVSA